MALAQILDRLDGGRRSGAGWMARCPAHADAHPSLSVGQGEDGRVLVHCHAGCTPGAVAAALDLALSDLFRRGSGHGSALRPTPPARPRRRARAVRDFAAEAARFRDALTVDGLGRLATDLSVAVVALRALGVGWASCEGLRSLGAGGSWRTLPEGAYAFPERDALGSVVGFSFRTREGEKGGPSRGAGARRGLVVPRHLDELPDPVLVAEGASDVAAALTIGVAAVGRPSNTGGVADLAELLRDRDVQVVGENDAKADGSWPGRAGAEHVARELSRAWGREVTWTLPPAGDKDLRAHVERRRLWEMGS